MRKISLSTFLFLYSFCVLAMQISITDLAKNEIWTPKNHDPFKLGDVEFYFNINKDLLIKELPPGTSVFIDEKELDVPYVFRNAKIISIGNERYEIQITPQSEPDPMDLSIVLNDYQNSVYEIITYYWKTGVPGFFKVSLGTEEAEMVRSHFFKKGVPEWARITEIERIQNIELLKWYMMKYNEMVMEKDYEYETEIEKRLFCSLGLDNKFQILNNGIDPRMIACDTKKNFNELGICIVFSELALTSYTQSKDKKSLFLCRVLTGKLSQKGKVNYMRPPHYSPKDSRMTDSVYGDFCKDTLYGIFDKSQILPEYLIEFEVSEDMAKWVTRHTSGDD